MVRMWQSWGLNLQRPDSPFLHKTRHLFSPAVAPARQGAHGGQMGNRGSDNSGRLPTWEAPEQALMGTGGGVPLPRSFSSLPP